MRSFVIATCFVGICAWGCSRQGPQQVADLGSSPNQEIAGTPYGDFIIGNPVSHENLTIFPISSKTPKNDDRFITLDEGLAAGTVKIIEIGGEQGEGSNNADDDPFGESSLPRFSEDDDPFSDDSSDDEDERDDDPFGSAPQRTDEPLANRSHGMGVHKLVALITLGAVVAVMDSVEQDEEEVEEVEPDVEELIELIDELEVAGDVNTLMVLNTSGRPLYLMPGEVISGGKQDRTIGEEIVIQSSETPVPIDVYCVEHGRWGGRSIEDTTVQLGGVAEFETNLSLVVSQTQGIAEIAEEAQRGKFVASVGQLNKDARLAVQRDGDQGRVWEEVARSNSKVGNASESGNFAANYTSGEVAKDFVPFIEKLKATGETTQIVGVAVAVNGKMLSVDVFESTPLFKKFWPKLLKSYALDAVAATPEEESSEKSEPVSVDDCIALLQDMESSQSVTEELAEGQTVAKRQSSQAASFSFFDAEAAEAAGVFPGNATTGFFGGSGGGGFGGAVHTGVLTH